ncbi:MAG: bifunctional nuclease family protein [Bacteroidales bacterium]|nr:bifunctional nuclease family protein [Bacteroidales bacterium]
MDTPNDTPEMAGLIELRVEDVLPSPQTTDAFSLILRELRVEEDEQGTHNVPTSRYISIIIGQSEARAILVELNKLPTHRPLTHELFHTLSLHVQCDLLMVNIIHFENGVYYADMVMLNHQNGKTIHIDARPSDAIALALKLGVMIHIRSEIFEENYQEDSKDTDVSGSIFGSPSYDYEEDYEKLGTMEEHLLNEAEFGIELSEMSLEELQELLEAAVDSEDYELAEKIQQEIDKRG